MNNNSLPELVDLLPEVKKEDQVLRNKRRNSESCLVGKKSSAPK